ncbi:unnamed protein product [Adineta steineri]|uniref:Uncharacterized protein n=1 Tax=Adineta steineri TaxID=433720 RepID=A0A815N1C0_9BILA|nr:unnamed protein product [Adineta steineri]CAF1428750.1 unnamed protein product [Adineta steineri]
MPKLYVHKMLSIALKTSDQRNLDRYPVQVHVLVDVDANISNQLEERLHEVKDKYTGEYILIIPYDSGNFHWIGLLIQFKDDKQIQRAVYIDPVNESNYSPIKLQEQFNKVFSNFILQPRTALHRGNQTESASLIVKNLLEAIAESKCKQVYHSTTNKSSDQVNNTMPLSSKTLKLFHLRSMSINDREDDSDEFTSTFLVKVPQIDDPSKKSDESTKESELSKFETKPCSTLSLEFIKSCSKDDCQITNESLKDTYKGFYLMPSCTERFLLSLQYLISLKLVDQNISLDHSIELFDCRKLEMGEELQCLKDRLKLEEILSIKIHDAVETLSIHIKNKNWRSSLAILKDIQHEIMPLNIYELFRLVKNVDDTANLIKDKKIIFFLGNTGSGKSTTIHFLAGSKMIRTNIQGLNHIAPTEIRNSDLKRVVTAPFAKSITRCITPVTVCFKDIGAYGHDSIILCDSPGFDDTNGSEIDIANGIAIVRAIQACESVKPVVLISYKSIGDRYEGLKDLTHTLARLIQNIKHQIKAFSYIFTKYPEHEKETVHASLETINDTLSDQERCDTNFMSILKDMLEKTKKKAYVLDPIQDDPSTILDEVADSTAINHPENVFQFFITKKSQTILDMQVIKYELSIKLATKRSEYSLVKYILDQLKFLSELLNQESVNQIYINCTKDVTRHLFEEYQKAILILNHSLLEETVLIDEEIKQYRTYVDRGSLAEDLRKTHLENEAIPNCAYIEYLNEKVDNLVETLQEKDINDLSIKLNIDKIKVLSEYFDDVNAQYKLICQFFSEKIEQLVDSFENSVLSNEFCKSISIMTKMYDANTILGRHLQTFNIEKKYSKMKDFFLNYLNGYVKKFHEIFFKEKLESADVENLNNCICTLEQVMNIFNLDLHISKVDVNKIYEEFSYKLLNYFEQIVENINNELKNKHTFYRLEQLFKDLDRLRTISSIAHKSNQIYYITVGKLVDHINETRIYVEELLRSLFRREEKITYDKMMKCLSNLQNAHWIENYRTRAYSEIIKDIEQQLIQHIKELEKSIMKSDLDLDNFTKISDAAKVLTEIDEMRRFENFIPILKQYIDEINSKFQGIISNVFIIIKDTLNLGKSNEQVYNTLDYHTAEKALLYLDACKTFHILKNDSVLLLNSLENYIRNYISFIRDEIKGYFDVIKQNENDISNKIEAISSRLQDLVEIKTTCNRIFSCFHKPIEMIIKDWKKLLLDYSTELSEEMDMLYLTQSIELFDKKLSIIKIFSNLDWFLEDGKYMNTYYKYQEKLLSQIHDIDKEIIDAIKNFDYELLDEKMVTLQSSNKVEKHFYQKAKRSLSIGLNRLKEDTKGLTVVFTHNIEKEQVKLIVDNLKRLEKAKFVIEKHLDVSHAIDEFIEEIKKSIETKMKYFLDHIKALVTNYNFNEADQKIDTVLLVRNLLGKYCMKNISDQIEILQNYGKIVVLPAVINKYSQMDISEYTLNPPKNIFEKLANVNSTNQIYSEVLDKLRKIILEKFRNELERAKIKQTIDITNEHIRRFESAVIYLPESMKNALEVELHHCTDDIRRLIQYSELKLQDSSITEEIDKINNCSFEYQNLQVIKSYFNKGKELASKRIGNIVDKIHQNLDKQNIMEVLNDMKTLYKYKTELNMYFNDIETIYIEVDVDIICVFEDAYQYFLNQIVTGHEAKLIKPNNDVLKKSFICLSEFIKFRDDVQNEQISNFILPQDFDEKMIRLSERIATYSAEQEKKYKVALENFDVGSLVDILDTMSICNFLLTEIQVYHGQHINKNSIFSSIVVNLEKLTSRPDMLESVCEKIENLGKELINTMLFDSNRKYHTKDRDEFYRKVDEKFSILSQSKSFRPLHLRIDVNKLEEECLQSIEKQISIVYLDVEKFLDNFSQEKFLTRLDYENFNTNFSNLMSIERTMETIQFRRKITTKKIKKIIRDKIKMWENSIEKEQTLENIANNLIKMKLVSINMPCLNINMPKRIEEILSDLRPVFKETDFATLAVIVNETGFE